MLVLDHWKYDGFEQHVEKVSDFYRARKDQCLAAVEKHMTGTYIVQVLLFASTRSLLETYAAS